jgi:hypothetical protein
MARPEWLGIAVPDNPEKAFTAVMRRGKKERFRVFLKVSPREMASRCHVG